MTLNKDTTLEFELVVAGKKYFNGAARTMTVCGDVILAEPMEMLDVVAGLAVQLKERFSGMATLDAVVIAVTTKDQPKTKKRKKKS